MTEGAMAVVSLSDGAKAIVNKIAALRALALEYVDACAEYDNIVSYQLGKIDVLSISVKGKRAGKASQSTTSNFNALDTEFDPMLQIVRERMHARVQDLYARIQTMKDDI